MDVVSSLDWLTLTHSKNVPDRATQFAETMTKAQRRGEYTEVKKHQWKGYDCLTVNGITYGERDDTVLAIFKGASAGLGLALCKDYMVNVTRIDLAVTIHISEPDAGMAARRYQKLGDERENADTLPKINLRQELLGGDTLYVGSRTSQYYGRLYDRAGVNKAALLGEIWRYEVEVKKPASRHVWDSLKDSNNIGGAITGWVHEWFCNRGITPLFSPGSGNIIIERDIKTSDNQRRLTWLRGQVSPTVKGLVKAGYKTKLKEMFDL